MQADEDGELVVLLDNMFSWYTGKHVQLEFAVRGVDQRESRDQVERLKPAVDHRVLLVQSISHHGSELIKGSLLNEQHVLQQESILRPQVFPVERWNEVVPLLQRTVYTVLQFSGHGSGEVRSLCFTDGGGREFQPEPAVFARAVMSQQSTPGCLVLNACHTAALGAAVCALCAEQGKPPPRVLCWAAEVNTRVCEALTASFFGALSNTLQRDATPPVDIFEFCFGQAQQQLEGDGCLTTSPGERKNQLLMLPRDLAHVPASTPEPEMPIANMTARSESLLKQLGAPGDRSVPQIYEGMRATSKGLATAAEQEWQDGPARAKTPAQKTTHQLQNRFASERTKHWLPFVDMVRNGMAECIWSSYFFCSGGPGPTRDFWIACDTSRQFTHASMRTMRATMFVNEGKSTERFQGGYVILHIHYAGTKSAPEKLRPRHVNARFAFSRAEMRTAFETEAAMLAAALIHGKYGVHHNVHLDMWAPGAGVCITGGCKNTNKCMEPYWECAPLSAPGSTLGSGHTAVADHTHRDFPVGTSGPEGTPIALTAACPKGATCGQCVRCAKFVIPLPHCRSPLAFPSRSYHWHRHRLALARLFIRTQNKTNALRPLVVGGFREFQRQQSSRRCFGLPSRRARPSLQPEYTARH